ncbi:MAG: hypothetical protein M1816_004786 [Peltula sp. TS41687]|nr:MAG: hypothetical protein M1816_004786 [Peltula sp. TS41687]
MGNEPAHILLRRFISKGIENLQESVLPDSSTDYLLTLLKEHEYQLLPNDVDMQYLIVTCMQTFKVVFATSKGKGEDSADRAEIMISKATSRELLTLILIHALQHSLVRGSTVHDVVQDAADDSADAKSEIALLRYTEETL